MKRFHFPCPLWLLLASLLPGSPGAAGQDVAPTGLCRVLWVVGAAAAPRVTLSQGCELMLFWGAVFFQHLLVWGLLCPVALGGSGTICSLGRSCWHGGLVRDLFARAARLRNLWVPH